MKTGKTILSATIFSLLLLSNCKKETGATGATGPQGPSGPVLTGNLKGFITHYDADGSKILSGLAGDSVFVDGTSLSAVTDAAGMYTFTNLTTGIYNLTITKPAFGNSKIQNIQFTGGGDSYRDGRISKVPTVNVTSAVAVDTVVAGVNYVKVRGGVPSLLTGSTLIFYVSIPGQSTVGPATTNYSVYYTKNLNPTVTTYNNLIPVSELYDAGFSAASTVYFGVYYVGNQTNASSYEDYLNGKTVFTAVSAVAANSSVVIP